MRCQIINLEQGMPTVEIARNRLNQALRTAKANGLVIVKIIHGYGSTGKGGAIKKDVQGVLASRKRSGIIKDFVKGEDFSPFNATTQNMIMKCPSLTKDSDYLKCNDGITIVIL